MMTHEMVILTSEPQDFQLLNDGSPLDGTGWTVTIVFQEDDAETTWPEDVVADWLDQTAGTVRVTGIENMPLGLHRFRFKLTDGGGQVGFVPNEAAPDVWKVVRI